MPRTKRPDKPIGYCHESDGSVGIIVFNIDRRRTTIFDIGWVRASEDGLFRASATFEEMQRYDEWPTHRNVDDAARSLLAWELMKTRDEGEQGDEEVGKIRSLERAEAFLPSATPGIQKALAGSAASAVTAAVTNMLRVSSYDEVMAAVNRAVVSEVIKS